MSISNYHIVKEISSGASPIKKYLVTKDNKFYLLRMYSSKYFKGRLESIENIKKLSQGNINIPRIIEYEYLPDQEYSYIVLEWIDGTSLDQILTSFNEEEYGSLVGQELRRFHQVPIESSNIKERFLSSISKRINRIKKEQIPIDISELERYIEQHKSVLDKQTSTITHGDIHPGNIITRNNHVYFIDLDVTKESHPWSDLSSNVTDQNNKGFYSSLINSYFDGTLPEDFWQVYNLYGILYLLDFVLYVKRENRALELAEQRINEFLKNNNHFSTEPSWYKVKRKED